MVDPKLKGYIEQKVFPLYERFYSHGVDHLRAVIENSLLLAAYYHLDEDMCYAVAVYHDAGLSVDRANHEKASGQLLWEDVGLRKFFDQEQMMIMKEAVEDHRGSRKVRPRSIYGEVVSDADRDFDIAVLAKRQLATSIKNYPDLTTFEEHFERCHTYILQRINGEGHFNLWTKNPILLERRAQFERDFLDKPYAQSVYKKEWDRITADGTIEKIKNYYQDK